MLYMCLDYSELQMHGYDSVLCTSVVTQTFNVSTGAVFSMYSTDTAVTERK